MRICFVSLLTFAFVTTGNCQSEDEEMTRFLDTLKMGNSYLIGKEIRPFDFEAENGKRYSSGQLKGKILFIDIWAAHCTPCIAVVPALNELYETFRSDSNFQFVSFCPKESGSYKEFVSEHKVQYPVVATKADYVYRLNFNKGFPTHMIVDANGKIVHFIVGGATDPAEAKKQLEADTYPLIRSLLNAVKFK